MMKMQFRGILVEWNDTTFEWSGRDKKVRDEVRTFFNFGAFLSYGDEFLQGGIGMKVFQQFQSEYGDLVHLISYEPTPVTVPEDVEGIVY